MAGLAGCTLEKGESGDGIAGMPTGVWLEEPTTDPNGVVAVPIVPVPMSDVDAPIGGIGGMPIVGAVGVPIVGSVGVPIVGRVGVPIVGSVGVPMAGTVGVPIVGKVGVPTVGVSGAPKVGSVVPSAGDAVPIVGSVEAPCKRIPFPEPGL